MSVYRFEITGRINSGSVDEAMDILQLELEGVVLDSKITLFDGKNILSER